MKKRMIRIIAAIMLMAFAMSMAACGNGSVYDDFADEGYSIRVRFEPCGAVVNETQNVEIVELYDPTDTVTNAQGKTGIKLLDPEDPRRGTDAVFKLAKNDGKNNFFSAGWYTSRTPRVDAQGNALDAYGELTSVSGREQGYVYSGRWDFANDVLDPASVAQGEEFTLYAAWIPFYTYEFYAQNDQGKFELIGSKANKIDLILPVYNERTGKWNMKDLPKVEGKEFQAAYLDEALTVQIGETVDGDNTFVDYEKGIATQHKVKIYVVYTPVQVD